MYLVIAPIPVIVDYFMKNSIYMCDLINIIMADSDYEKILNITEKNY